jgi:hypothetical protein
MLPLKKLFRETSGGKTKTLHFLWQVRRGRERKRDIGQGERGGEGKESIEYELPHWGLWKALWEAIFIPLVELQQRTTYIGSINTEYKSYVHLPSTYGI